MSKIIKQIQSRYQSIMVALLSVLIVGTFLYVGYAIFKHGGKLTATQVTLLDTYMWFLGLAFILVVVNWFGSAIPQVKDIISSIIGARFGNVKAQETLAQPPINPLPPIPSPPNL